MMNWNRIWLFTSRESAVQKRKKIVLVRPLGAIREGYASIALSKSLKMLSRQVSREQIDQQVEIDRLGYVIRNAGQLGVTAELDSVVSGQSNYWNTFESWGLPDRPGGSQAVDHRQGQVHQDQAG